jgi:hypothetical protein
MITRRAASRSETSGRAAGRREDHCKPGGPNSPSRGRSWFGNQILRTPTRSWLKSASLARRTLCILRGSPPFLKSARTTHLFGTLHLARAILKQAPDCLLIFAGSGQVYGDTAKSGLPLDETALLAPVMPPPKRRRGRGQTEDFVVPSFASQIARIEAGRQPPVIRVGNLEAQRDFLDVAMSSPPTPSPSSNRTSSCRAPFSTWPPGFRGACATSLAACWRGARSPSMWNSIRIACGQAIPALRRRRDPDPRALGMAAGMGVRSHAGECHGISARDPSWFRARVKGASVRGEIATPASGNEPSDTDRGSQIPNVPAAEDVKAKSRQRSRPSEGNAKRIPRGLAVGL